MNSILIINDYIELASLADGLHIGQEDLLKIDSNIKDAIKKIKEELPSKMVGISTHNKEEILLANETDIDYIGLGAYRDSSTKKDINIKGKELLELSFLSKHPVALIGGVKIDDNFDGYNIKYKVIGKDLVIKYLNSR